MESNVITIDPGVPFVDESFPQEMMPDIRRFFAHRHPALIKGMDLYPEVFSTNLFFPLQRMGELSRMMRIARSIKPKKVMEIGSDKGGGFYHWCMCLPTVTHLIACEIRGTPYREEFEKAFPDLKFLWINADSKNVGCVRAAGEFGKLKAETMIDVLFIDGEKSTFDKDFDAYLPYMNPRGIVFMHDIQDSAPRSAYWRVVNRGYRHEEIIDKSDTHEALQRRAAGIPSRSAHENWLRTWEGRSCGVGVIYLDSSFINQRG